MNVNTEAIVLRQVKTVNGRRMILLFSEKYGKISAGTSVTERGRGKAALLLRPFTCGRYELFKGRDVYSLNGGEVLHSFYRIGEDVDKYMAASYVLEFTDKILPEELPCAELFSVLKKTLQMLSERQKKFATLVLAYEVKALALLGQMPELQRCVVCGSAEGLDSFAVREGGLVCSVCRNKMEDGRLIFGVSSGIVSILRYFIQNPMESFEKLALEDGASGKLQSIIKKYAEYHLDIGELKTESYLLSDN